jgi:hypothetical protein
LPLINQSRDSSGSGKEHSRRGILGKTRLFSQNVALGMGRRSKATQSRLQNLGEASKSQRTRVQVASDDVTSDEDASEDSESSGDAAIVDIGTGAEHGFIFFEDYETDSESDDDSDDHIPGSNDSEDSNSDFEDEETNEIKIEADLLRFSAILTEAQRIAVKLEQESDAPKRPKRYTGNAPRTKRFHAQKRRTLAAEGQKFIGQFFIAKEKMPPRQSVNQLPIA